MSEICDKKFVLNDRKVVERISREKRFREKYNSFNESFNGLHERKSFKTNVFSGFSKTIVTTKSLKELCYDKLSERLDKLVVNEDIAYEIIRPLLTNCCALELQRVEDMNPLLVSQTDDLWLELSRNEFHFTDNNKDHNYYNNSVPNKTSGESWRQFYWRCIEYRTKKLNEITASIRDKNHSLKSNQRLTKVCEIEVKKLKKPEPLPKKCPKIAPLMRKCLQIKKQKFML